MQMDISYNKKIGGCRIMHFDPNDRQSLTARVYEHIREDIIEGRYANGAYLVETKLAEELGILLLDAENITS